MDEPLHGSNADESALTATERRDLILATLTIQRQFYQLWARWLTVQELELYLTGERSL